MSILTHKQLSLAEIYSDCSNSFENDKHHFLSLLEENLNIGEFIPFTFYNRYYASTGRPREHQLSSMLWAFILQRIFSIPTDTLLITFLKFSKELRDFCGFVRVPDASRFTRFKQEFLSDLQSFFDHLVDVTEPICQEINPAKASMTIFDTSGIEAYVTENNPKYSHKIIKHLKAFKKANKLDDSYDPYKAAYGSMPSHSASNSEIKQLYINGHFCYVYKFGMVTNGLGIVRDISFYNKDFMDNHPNIILDKKSDSPDEDKSLHDTKALIPVLTDFFEKHPLIQPKSFLGDAAFDSTTLYDALLNNLNFEKAFIPLNSRSKLSYPDCPVNEDGIPCCPSDTSLPMKYEGIAKRKNGLIRHKFICPKVKWIKHDDGKYKRQCFCDNPCTASSCGRMFYIYPEKNLRAYPGTIRGSDEWLETYKIRTTVERSIHHFKGSYNVANRKTQNEKTLHADLLLAGITQLFTVVLANNINQHQFIRSLKPLIA
ncbi:hypothetical protein HNR33_004660 [Brassicibacter mesophilus]